MGTVPKPDCAAAHRAAPGDAGRRVIRPLEFTVWAWC